MKLKAWLKKILGITELEKINQIQKQTIFILEKRIKEDEKELKDFKDLLKVGIDIRPREGSWAVICLQGSTEYVQFVRLDEKSIRDIGNFVRQYTKTEKAVFDLPLGMSKKHFF